jgi:hypothetical protein
MSVKWKVLLFVNVLISVQSHQANTTFIRHYDEKQASQVRKEQQHHLRKLSSIPSASVSDIMKEIVSPASGSHSKNGVGSIGSKSEVRPMSLLPKPEMTKELKHVLDITTFENNLRHSWEHRSLFRPKVQHNVHIDIPKVTSEPLPDVPSNILKNIMSERVTYPPQYDAEEEEEEEEEVGGGSQNERKRGRSEVRPLLAILHPSSISWPERLDVLVTTIIPLESAEV